MSNFQLQIQTSDKFEEQKNSLCTHEMDNLENVLRTQHKWVEMFPFQSCSPCYAISFCQNAHKIGISSSKWDSIRPVGWIQIDNLYADENKTKIIKQNGFFLRHQWTWFTGNHVFTVEISSSPLSIDSNWKYARTHIQTHKKNTNGIKSDMQTLKFHYSQNCGLIV